MKSKLLADSPYQHLVDEIHLAGKKSAYKALIECLEEEIKTQLLYVARQKRLKRENKHKRNTIARSIRGERVCGTIHL